MRIGLLEFIHIFENSPKAAAEAGDAQCKEGTRFGSKNSLSSCSGVGVAGSHASAMESPFDDVPALA